MQYSPDQIWELKNEFATVKSKYSILILQLMRIIPHPTNQKSYEFLAQGVCRRLGILERCIANVYNIFPPDRPNKLSQNERHDTIINLHAFYVNIYGVFDNLAWVYAFHNDLIGPKKDGKLSRMQIGIFNDQFKKALPVSFTAYLDSRPVQAWYKEYLKSYRDSLAHRIPLYIPPASLNDEEMLEHQELEKGLMELTCPEAIQQNDEIYDKQAELGTPCPVFAHSFSEETQPVYMHLQLLADFSTVREITEKFLEHCFDVKNQTLMEQLRNG